MKLVDIIPIMHNDRPVIIHEEVPRDIRIAQYGNRDAVPEELHKSKVTAFTVGKDAYRIFIVKEN